MLGPSNRHHSTCDSSPYTDNVEPSTLFLLLFFKAYLRTLAKSLDALQMQLGWIYGSITEDILTGFKMHCRGWRSIYCMPERPAFKGSAPINLSDRLNQVLRWALGSVEIFFSRHSPVWYGYKGGNLKWLERFAYINTTIYPFTSLPLLAYCTLPAICLLTGKFIMPTVIILHLVQTEEIERLIFNDKSTVTIIHY